MRTPAASAPQRFIAVTKRSAASAFPADPHSHGWLDRPRGGPQNPVLLDLRHIFAALGRRGMSCLLATGAISVSAGVPVCRGAETNKAATSTKAAPPSRPALPPIPDLELSAWPEAVRR